MCLLIMTDCLKSTGWESMTCSQQRAKLVRVSSCQAAGVMSVYLFMKRYTAEEMYRPHQGFYRPRLSNCSDYSGQFLHPDAWTGRGRSPSSISSEASLQMNSSNYPALLKCPEYEQMSSSPCWRWAVGAPARMLKWKKEEENFTEKVTENLPLPGLNPNWVRVPQSSLLCFLSFTPGVGERLLPRFGQLALSSVN